MRRCRCTQMHLPDGALSREPCRAGEADRMVWTPDPDNLPPKCARVDGGSKGRMAEGRRPALAKMEMHTSSRRRGPKLLVSMLPTSAYLPCDSEARMEYSVPDTALSRLGWQRRPVVDLTGVETWFTASRKHQNQNVRHTRGFCLAFRVTA